MRIGFLTTCSFLLFLPFAVSAADRPTPRDCTYEMQVWNINEKTAGRTQKIAHAYDDVSMREKDSVTGCTVCIEDQELISIPPLQPFSVCYAIAPRVRGMISGLVKRGAGIKTIVGYHVIKSRGNVDGKGNRTEFSNHSFGTAVDINSEQNGLYDDCISFNSECRLLRGGKWRPGTPGTLERDSNIVIAFKAAGFLWGGEIAGKQKDFMHFSLTGY